MTMPAYNSFELYKGDTLRFSLSLSSNNNPYLIPDGTEFTGSIKKKGSSVITSEFNSEIVSASSGKVLFVLDTTNSTLLDANKNWVYDIQMKFLDETVTTILTGNIFVTDEVTL